jgi:hypothetical protein
MLKALRKVDNEWGVAMVTVLFVAAVMTVIASTATFITIEDLKAGGDDRRATQSLAYGEAGIDRMIQATKEKQYGWQSLIQSGCGSNQLINIPGEVGDGEFTVSLQPSKDGVIGGTACPDAANLPEPWEAQEVTIVSDGVTRDAKRRVEQVVNIAEAGFPIGVFAFTAVSVSGFGEGELNGISVITPGPFIGRDKLETVGYDPWYTQRDFYGAGFPDERCDTIAGGCNSAQHMPAAVHAGQYIECDTAGSCNRAGQVKREHVPPGTLAGGAANKDNLNCTANVGAMPAQSAWDGSGNGGPTTGLNCPSPNIGKAPTSLFTPEQALELAPKPELTEDDYEGLKEGAQEVGIYCVPGGGGGLSCTKEGQPYCGNCTTFTDADLEGLPNNYIVYVDYPPTATPESNSFNWNALGGDCDLDPDLSKSTVMVIRNGGVNIAANKGIAGAVLAREGVVDVGGGAFVHGSVIANRLNFRGSSNFLMDACSIRNLTAPSIAVTPVRWREVDR